jgi:hypothetical protein
VDAWPVLIGAGLAFDPDLPSPAQFNHVITYLPGGGPVQWLDTTPEIAPYGYLDQVLRDQQVLLIPAGAAPRVVSTPPVLPYAAAETISMKAKLAADGTLTGHFELSARGDTEVVLRELFHSTGPVQWTPLVQKIAAAMGYGGAVKEVEVENPTNLDPPFHYSCNYDRKEYADWPHRRISAPLPPMTLLATDEKFKPKEPVYFGALGKVTYRGSIELPEGYSAEVPGNVRLQSEMADYSATYSLEGRTLSVERALTVKSSKLSAATGKSIASSPTRCRKIREPSSNWCAAPAPPGASPATFPKPPNSCAKPPRPCKATISPPCATTSPRPSG